MKRVGPIAVVNTVEEGRMRSDRQEKSSGREEEDRSASEREGDGKIDRERFRNGVKAREWRERRRFGKGVEKGKRGWVVAAAESRSIRPPLQTCRRTRRTTC